MNKRLPTYFFEQSHQSQVTTQKNHQLNTARNHTSWRVPFRMAATFALLITLSYLVYAGIHRNMVMLTASEKIRKEILADGSIVWMKPNTTLAYPPAFTGSSRSVELIRGEVLFEVAKDPDHPFVIQCGELKATVLGTSFHIGSGKKNTKVAVFTGKVALTTGQESIEVLPNETATFRKKNRELSKKQMKKRTRAELIAGTEYDMSFRDATVKSIADKIEKKFDVNVTVEGLLGQQKVTADFTDKSLNETMDIITALFDAAYEINGNQVVLKRN